MRINTLHIIFITLLLTTISCSKDKEASPGVQEEQEEVQEETLEPPSVFEILMDEVTFTSATLSWTVPEGTNNENLTYSLYLNNELIVESQIEQSYVFEELQNATSYTVKVTAINDDGETPIMLSFETLDVDDYILLIEKSGVPLGDYPTRFYYNEDNTLRFVDLGDFSIHYYYDIDGNLIEQRNNQLTVFVVTNIAYSNGEFSDVDIVKYDDDNFIKYKYEYDFNSSENYQVTYTISDFSDVIISVNNYEVVLDHDNENRVIYYKRTDTDSQQLKAEIFFEYLNENLVKIISTTNNQVIDFVFDDKNNFRAYNHYNSNLTWNQLIWYYQNNFIDRELLYIPDFTFFKNKNNPVQVLENGVSVKRWEYDYNEFGYPINIKNPNTGVIFGEFEYLIIEN